MVTTLKAGEPAPWFVAPCIGGSPNFAFDTMAGRYVLLLFYGSAARPACREALDLVERHRALFDDRNASFFGVSVDRGDVDEARVGQSLPGVRHLFDRDRTISRSFGVMFPSANGEVHRPAWMLLDPMLRLVEYRPLAEGEAIFARLRSFIDRGPPALNAPVLLIPRVFEPELCRTLIDLYDRGEQRDSGYMVERDGKTVGVVDYRHKRRTDCTIEDQDLRDMLRERINRSIVPMVARAFQFEVTRVERWIVACYDADVGGYFRAHRDNTTSGTAHRRFACSINLNAEEFEGGGVSFPEFGSQAYRPETGGAVIFSCSLLHEARPVTRGRRYAFLPFFYDERAAAVRLANNASLGADVSPYRTSQPVCLEDPDAVPSL